MHHFLKKDYVFSTPPHSTKLYKWVPCDLLLGINPAMNRHPIQGEKETLWIIALSFRNQDTYCNNKYNYLMSSPFHKLTCQYLVYILEAILLFYDQECSYTCNKLHKITEYQNSQYCSAKTTQYVQHCQHLQRKSSLSISSKNINDYKSLYGW